MPTPPDMTTDSSTDDERAAAQQPVSAAPTAAPAAPSGSRDAESVTSAASVPDSGTGASAAGDASAVLDLLQHQVAVFARRAEQTRLGGVGQARNSMDRAAYLLLNRLDKQGPMGVKALAAGMGIDSSTVTRQVAPLVDAGLVSRASHPEDGRAVVLKLSPRGSARLEEVRSSRRELMNLLTAEWSEEDRNAFCELLTRFNTALLGVHPPGGVEAPGAETSGPELPSAEA